MKEKILLLIFLIVTTYAYGDSVTEPKSFDEGIFHYEVVTKGEVRISEIAMEGITQPMLPDSILRIPGKVKHNKQTYIVRGVKQYAFGYCASLKHLYIEEGVHSIDDYAFYACPNLESIHLPKSLKYIGDAAFGWATSLRHIKVAEDNTILCSPKGSNVLIDQVQQSIVLGTYCAVIPENVRTIETEAFLGCDIRGIAIPEGVEEIENCAFSHCYNLERIQLPNTLKRLGSFHECGALRSIVIPKNVSKIGNALFGGCHSLRSISVDQENKFFDSRDSCNAIIETTTNKIVAACVATSFPKSVKSIGKSSMFGIRFNSLFIPKSIEAIEEGAFGNMLFLTEIKVDKNNPVYNSDDDCNAIIETSTGKLVAGCTNTTITKQVKEIGAYAFANGVLPTVFVIPPSVRKIGKNAFQKCSGIERLVLSKNIDHIGDFAFVGCHSLSSIVWNGQVIPNSAFSGCHNLRHIDIPLGTKEIRRNAFRGCSNLKSVVIPITIKTIENGAFAETPLNDAINKRYKK